MLILTIVFCILNANLNHRLLYAKVEHKFAFGLIIHWVTFVLIGKIPDRPKGV